MASLVLGAVGSAVGGTLLGSSFSFLGMSGAALGGLVGSTVGSVVDSMIIAGLQPDQRIEGQRLETQRITSSTEGMPIPWVAGRMRLGGNTIWATDFREEVITSSQGGGKGGGGPRVTTTEYRYYASFAVAICEGPVAGIGRVWADGDLLEMQDITWRFHPGSETQAPDPVIQAAMGADATPAYRGVCYAVFEDLPLADFGNRLPQLTFEVFRPIAEPGSMEHGLKAVCLIPGTGEFAYATTVVRAGSGGDTEGVNAHASAERSDFLEALDRLTASAPNLESVSLVVSWFGTDLRAGHCLIRPGVETVAKTTSPISWSAGGIGRGAAHLVSSDGEGRPLHGGTPSDASVVEAIQAIRARGLRVTFYPFILMDVPPGNTRPNPYSDNAAQTGQPVFPWRGRITCSPAAGYAGSVDRTGTAAAQVQTLFGTADADGFSVSGTSVSFLGPPDEWSIRRMILHYAHLCAAAGGVDAFLISSEMVGLTTIRSSASAYPAVAQLVSLAGAARSVLGAGTKISYAADWSEYFGHQPADGSGDVYFHLDPLWASSNVDFVGIDTYMPLSDWRDGHDHADAAEGAPSIHDRDYLRGNIEGGEGFDWYYASPADRDAQVRTPITDGAEGKDWVFRYKDLRGWWSNSHFNRPGGVESGTPTAWVPEAKPIRFTEFGCPAVDRGTNQPNVFLDPKSSESTVPHYSRGWRDDAIQRAAIEAVLGYWDDPALNPVSSVYGGRMITMEEAAAWAFDARPYPFFPALDEVWSDGGNWRLGHWLTGRLGSAGLPALVRVLCRRAGMPDDAIDVSDLSGAIEGYAIGAIESPRTSLGPVLRHFGIDGVETGGVIRFRMRGRAPSMVIRPDDLVAAGAQASEDIELTRGQETELPQALKWTMARADEEYDAAMVEARRITVQAARVAAETFPFAVAPEEAERRCRRALIETWVGRESASFALAPSRLALDAGDVVLLEHDGRALAYRLSTIAHAAGRSVTAARHDRDAYDLPPGAPRASSVGSITVYGAGIFEFLDLPALSDGDLAHQPLLASWSRPWPGEIAVYRSLSQDGWSLLTTSTGRARLGALATALPPGPVGRFDMSNQPEIVLREGTLGSIPDLDLFQGGNALAVETAPNVWEVLQASQATLVAPQRYRLARLLRGQRGTEHAMGGPTPAGARVVILDGGLRRLPLGESDIGVPWNWRLGAASKPVSGDGFTTVQHTPSDAGLRPFTVAHVSQPSLRGRTPGDLTISWVRRSREIAADSWELVEVPLGEESEAYEIEILDGATVKRVLSTTTTSAVYTAAQQTADWGALLGPGDTLDIRIFQLSALVGRGAPKTVTLTF